MVRFFRLNPAWNSSVVCGRTGLSTAPDGGLDPTGPSTSLTVSPLGNFAMSASAAINSRVRSAKGSSCPRWFPRFLRMNETVAASSTAVSTPCIDNVYTVSENCLGLSFDNNKTCLSQTTGQTYAGPSFVVLTETT